MRHRYRTWAEWLADNPPPDLQALVNEYGRSEFELMQDRATSITVRGGFSDIPPEVWARFEAEMADWQYRRRHR
jgi:hypothetical protein